MKPEWTKFAEKKIKELEHFFKTQNKNTALKKILPIAIPTLLFLISIVQIGQTKNHLIQEQATSSATSEELAALQEKYESLQNEFETYKTENKEFILAGKTAIQAQKEEQQLKEAEKAVIDLEKALAKDKIETTKQQVEKLSDQTKKNDLLNRIQKVQEQIAQKEKTEKALAEAEKVVKNLEDNQTKENSETASQQVQGLPDSEQKSTLLNRIAAVNQAITQKEEQAAAEQAAKEAASRETQATPAPAAPAGDTTYYKNCAAVRAAGAAPIYQGQPGYARHLDRDGDGIACE
ncbi:excalibur calcium-binding domain-containing protein [Streptococcus acidominimus]|uniref:Excalibur domain-containing protein n=1 Tax=Streptococcus acidominimus TaxID=1326 RepID=A0A1Q8ECI7_STRAI|nr:excalibur calcium-binding domain-containing protein [Streptococcus acidominimus]OLF49506.1 hypothetical protein BU200_06925 [Streptococcus acidominimus]SUN07140.1 excalibur domain-containing protein [Streptococcus acidominimus]